MRVVPRCRATSIPPWRSPSSVPCGGRGDRAATGVKVVLCTQTTNYRSGLGVADLPSIRVPALADHPRNIIYFQETSPAS
jgi:hypothetical protein